MRRISPYPCALPTIPIPQGFDPKSLSSIVVPLLEKLGSEKGEGALVEDAIWRDLFALTGSLRTFHSRASVHKAWKETSKTAKVKEFEVVEDSVRVVRLPEQPGAWIEIQFSFRTAIGTGCGFVNLVPSSPDAVSFQVGGDGVGEGTGKGWKIWILKTILEGLDGVPDVDHLSPVPSEPKFGVAKMRQGLARAGKGGSTGGDLFGEGKQKEWECVVIGGGLAGLSVGGRLKALGVRYVVLDKGEEVGDCWAGRYGSARLHTTREYAHLPFERTFTKVYEEYLSKDDLAKGYKGWAERYGINVQTSTTVLSGTWDVSKQLWTLKVRQREDEFDIMARYVVLAGGAGGQVPVFPGPYKDRDLFEGITMHSAEYKNCDGWKGKHGVVVGTANTAHDVAEDMVEAGLESVTMIQRSRTYVLPAEHFYKIASLSYTPHKPTHISDRASFSNPMGLAELMSQAALYPMAAKEPERFDKLEEKGFKVERYGNIQDNLLIRLGGHYMDVGGSGKICDGKIKVISTSLPSRYTKDSLIFEDGSFIKADVIVFATGFVGNMREQVDQLFGKEVGDQVGDFWGLDGEGELKGAFRGTGHPALWLHGGSIGQGRYFSRFIALQIKAKLMGIKMPVYDKTP